MPERMQLANGKFPLIQTGYFPKLKNQEPASPRDKNYAGSLENKGAFSQFCFQLNSNFFFQGNR